MVILTIILFSFCFSYDGPDDGAGDPSATKEARMDGNRILLYFKNTTQLSDWEAPSGLNDVSIWPNDGTGYRMLDGIGLLVGGLFAAKLISFSFIPDFGDMITRFSGITICSITTGVIWISQPESLLDVILYDNLHVFLWVVGLYFALRGNRT